MGSPQGHGVCPWILTVSKDTPGSRNHAVEGSGNNAVKGHEVTSIWGEKQGFRIKLVDLLLSYLLSSQFVSWPEGADGCSGKPVISRESQ